jgi:hypothetical protein
MDVCGKKLNRNIHIEKNEYTYFKSNIQTSTLKVRHRRPEYY